MYFLSMCLSGIMAIMNNKCDSTSPRNRPLWIFASAKFLSPAINSTLQVFIIIIIIIIITLLAPFSNQSFLVVFYWNLNDSKSFQVSKTVLSILANFNNSVV